MISKKNFSGKLKKALCGIFCARSISEFNNSCKLDQWGFVRFEKQKMAIGAWFSKLQKDQRGEETRVKWLCHPLKFL